MSSDSGLRRRLRRARLGRLRLLRLPAVARARRPRTSPRRPSSARCRPGTASTRNAPAPGPGCWRSPTTCLIDHYRASARSDRAAARRGRSRAMPSSARAQATRGRPRARRRARGGARRARRPRARADRAPLRRRPHRPRDRRADGPDARQRPADPLALAAALAGRPLVESGRCDERRPPAQAARPRAGQSRRRRSPTSARSPAPGAGVGGDQEAQPSWRASRRGTT